jgi:Lsr2
MRISFDSSDDLATVLAAVSAVYGVQVVVAPTAPTPAAAVTPAPASPAPAKQARPRPTAKASRTSTRRAKTTEAPASASDIRVWAEANGHHVSSRGRIPATVTAAYRAANGR